MNCKDNASNRMRGHNRVQMKENNPRIFLMDYNYANIRYRLLLLCGNKQNEHAQGKAMWRKKSSVKNGGVVMEW
jgi:hypothetical protein